ncbi:MAG TPA: sirohydrochlorin nickelochelatase [Methanocorpusculum sp.]|nr:sirohydrochlorin nickelochelatase [Methanocorpusculum sp.]
MLIAHGDRTGDALKQTAALAGMMQEMSGAVVGFGFLQFARPGIAEALDAMRGYNIDVLIAVPVFLWSGVHVTESIPHSLGISPASGRGEFVLADGKRVLLVYAAPVGAGPELAKLLLRRVDDAEAPV